jgi:hypothetical protein
VPLAVDAAGFPVLSDTNQIKLFPALKVEWRTNLYEAETLTFVSTNAMPVGIPVAVVVDGNPMRRQYESLTLVTNVSHRLNYGGTERVFLVSQTLGPVIGTRHNDFPPPLPPPMLAVPVRNEPR